MIGIEHYLVVSAALFCLGLLGVLTRRNAIIALMSLELMLNAANINLIAFSAQLQSVLGQVFSVFVIAIGPSRNPDSSTQAVPVISPFPLSENHPANTGSLSDLPRGSSTVTPVRTGPTPTSRAPSPPSDNGSVLRAAVGQAFFTAPTITAAACLAVRDPFSESGAMRMFMRLI